MGQVGAGRTAFLSNEQIQKCVNTTQNRFLSGLSSHMVILISPGEAV